MGLTAQTWITTHHQVQLQKYLHHIMVLPTLTCTFDISQISPFASGTQQDAATIVAEVSAAAVAQALKEFAVCVNPKLPS